MEPLTDTDPETARVHMELLRRASPERRLRLALSLSRSVITLSRDGIAHRHPDAGAREIGLEFVRLHYGEELADGLRAAPSFAPTMTAPDIVAAVRPVLDVLGVLRAGVASLDRRYLAEGARELAVDDLLERALGEAART